MSTDTPPDLPPVTADLSDIEFIRVFTTYVHAGPLATAKNVLDAGCGTGHGSWLMGKHGARTVVAVDLAPSNAELVRDISRMNGRVRGAVMDVQELGLADGRFDLVVCFEVIEHVPEPARLLAELRRVATPAALTLLSTPNRRVRLGRGERPFNPDHLREYDLLELRAILERSYAHVQVVGIYGRADLHQRYLDEWRPTLARRVRRSVRDALPVPARNVVRAMLADRRASALATTARSIPDPEPASWPFYVDDVSERCLNFLAVCADDDRSVSDAVRRLLA